MIAALPGSSPLEAWVLDLDGTVVDSSERFHGAYCAALAERRLEAVDLAGFNERSRAGTLVTALGLTEGEGAAFWGTVMTGFLASERPSVPLPGVRERLLAARAAGVPLALVTGRVYASDALEEELGELGLGGLFDCVLAAGELRLVEGARQVKDDLFATASAELGVDGSQCGYVTDWPPDLEDGVRWGFGLCVGVTTGGFELEDFPRAPRVAVRATAADVLDELLAPAPAAARPPERDELLDRARACDVISVHEHLGFERLAHAEGATALYEQRWEDLPAAELAVLGGGDMAPERVAAACFPMPRYTRFKEVPARSGGDLYEARNRSLFALAADRPAGDPLLLPVLAVDGALDAAGFERSYRDLLPAAAALKWHPFAQELVPRDFVAAGHLELAGSLGLPVVLHCARPGVEGDLGDAIDDVIAECDRTGAVVDVAHAGFLHDRLPELAERPRAYVDVSPWNLVCDTAIPAAGEAERVRRLAALLAQHAQQALVGLDSPWSRIHWPDGRTFGTGPAEDARAIAAALRTLPAPVPQQVLRDNPLRWLHSLPVATKTSEALR